MPIARRVWPAAERARMVVPLFSAAVFLLTRKEAAAEARERVAPQDTRIPVVRRPMKKALVPAHMRVAMRTTSIPVTTLSWATCSMLATYTIDGRRTQVVLYGINTASTGGSRVRMGLSAEGR